MPEEGPIPPQALSKAAVVADPPRVAVVGGGLAGMMALIKICEAGGIVDLFSLVPTKRSHSVAAQGGINGAVNTKGEGDSPWEHFDDTIYGGDFLANQPPVKRMCEAAPDIINLLDRMGVMFNRTPEGLIDFRAFGGMKHHRTAFAGATTGQQILYALNDQGRRWEVNGRVRRFEGWDFLGPVLDSNGEAIGVVAQDLTSMTIEAFPADAVVVASGGLGLVFGKSTNSVINTGAAAAACWRAGAKWANGEFVQVHPTAIPGPDKLRLMSESIRGEGGRVWVPRDGKPWYFLEDMYPAYGNLVTRDVATRAIHKVVVEMGLGVDGERAVYLDVTHLPRELLDRKLGGVMEIYEKFAGVDPREHPMKVYPAVHYSMGGLWVDPDTDMTTIPGLFAAGECEYQYHGANRLGANSLLSCIYDGFVAGPQAFAWAAQHRRRERPRRQLEAYRKSAEAAFSQLLHMEGDENPYALHREMGERMTDHVTVVRDNAKLKETLSFLAEVAGRWRCIGLHDRGRWVNQEAQFVRHLGCMIDLARMITKGALLRDESRGAHYKPAFPKRDDRNWLKTTLATFRPGDEADISYEAVDTSLIPPRTRRYDVEKEEGQTPAATDRSTRAQSRVRAGKARAETRSSGRRSD